MKRTCFGLVVSVALSLAALFYGPSTAWAQAAPPLGAVQPFGVLGGSAVTAAGPAGTVISGSVGSAPTSTVSGFPPAVVTAGFTVYTAADAVTAAARAGATTAYLNLAAQSCPAPNVIAGGILGGLNLGPGVYCMPAGDLTGTLTLTGGAADVWVFQMTGSTLTTAGASQVVMGGAANACNVYWQVSSSATLGAASTFRGNIFSGVSIGIGTTANVIGRAIAGSGAVTMDGSNTVGGCSAAPVPPTITKAFSAVSITAGDVSRLTITLNNPNPADITLTAGITDTLPVGVQVAAVPTATTTCGGVVTAPGGGSTITLATGSTVPSGSCNIAVNVTAAAPGSFVNTIAAGALQTTAGNNAVPATATLTVTCPVITIAPVSLPNGTQGVAFSETFTGGGGTAPYTFSITAGTLPTGLTLSAAGVLSGTPTVPGPYTFSVTATAANGCSQAFFYPIVILTAVPTLPQWGALLLGAGLLGLGYRSLRGRGRPAGAAHTS